MRTNRITLAILAAIVFFAVGAVQAFAEDAPKSSFYLRKGFLPKSSFDPGDEAVVLIRVMKANDTPGNFRVKDRYPVGSTDAALVPAADVAGKCGSPSGARITAVAFNAVDSSAEWTGPIEADSFICYSIKLPLIQESKNELYQSETLLLRQNDQSGDYELLQSLNSYVLIRGFTFENSLRTDALGNPTPDIDAGPNNERVFPIDDQITLSGLFFGTKTESAESSVFSTLLSYIYQKGQGAHSRGGDLLQLPVKVSDKSGNLLASSQYYLLYNPAFYLFGNIFSENGTMSKIFDMGSRSQSISSEQNLDETNAQKDLNAMASIYNYDIDKKSVIYWDTANPDKNAKMYENINALIGSPRDPIVCDISAGNLSGLGNLYLDNPNCRINGVTPPGAKAWPNGRVWYVESAAGEIKISGKIHGKGTIIVNAASGGTVKVMTDSSDFSGNPAPTLGLMVINGGQVEIAKEASQFRGIIFVPGKTATDGYITFAGDSAQKIKIFGSLVANSISFAKREIGNYLYSASIYSDAEILASPPPGFENMAGIIWE